MNDLIGRTLGLYRIIDKIGEGGMAAVYKAYQSSLDRYVAIKVLPPVHAKQSGFSERFQREARAIANLHHPNILPVYDSGQEDDYSFLVMRHIEGARTLREVMVASLALTQVTDLIGQIAAALDHAHQQGVIHRDVKPSNVLMDGNWALLTDFGLAKMTEASVKLTGTGVGVGTPAYMSPEQGQGATVDRRTDIYSLGVILFEMLTGQIPHNAETPFAIVLKRVTEPLPMPRILNPEIPPTVERVILKALATDPADRFETAGELATALRRAVEGAVDGAPTPAAPPPSIAPPPPRAGEPKRRSSRGLILIGGVGLLLILLIACGLTLGGMVARRRVKLTATAAALVTPTPTSLLSPAAAITTPVTPTPTRPPPSPTPPPTSTPTPAPTDTPMPTLTPLPTHTPMPTLPMVIEKDLGIVHFSQAPKTWTIDIPPSFSKVEIALYGSGKDETNKYGGWMAYLKINGQLAWEFLRFDSEIGGIIHDYSEGEEVLESSGTGQYLDVTGMIKAGKNTITYYHYTEGDGIGVKLVIRPK